MSNYSSSHTGTQIDGFDARLINLESSVLNILNVIYPVGSIYLSVNSTNPGTLFGGTWE